MIKMKLRFIESYLIRWSSNEAIIHVPDDISEEAISVGQKQNHKNALICQPICVSDYTTDEEFPAVPFSPPPMELFNGL